jgi:hypothetical protein
VNCGQEFVPDTRNARHQCYCGAAACKAASKRASQAKWLAKNPDYHRGPEAVARIKAWRQEHPGYSRRKGAVLVEFAIQETLAFERNASAPMPEEAVLPAKISCNAPEADPGPPLQDFMNAQPIVLIGLIAHIWGSTLQDDIASALTRLLQLGQDIRGGRYEHRDEAAIESGTSAAGARALQLARSSAGAGTLHREG